MYFGSFCVLLIAVNNFSAVLGTSTKQNLEDRLMYPGPTKEFDMNRYGSLDEDIPVSCREQNFCTVKPKNYPEKEFSEMFKDMNHVLPSPQFVPNFDNRQGDPNDKDDCDSTTSFDPLYKIREKRSAEWRDVVQVPEKGFVQKVRLEECRNVNASCFSVFPTIEGFTTYCKQKYTLWELVVAAEGAKKTEVVSTELPTCCSCTYRDTGLGNRFLNSLTTPAKKETQVERLSHDQQN